MEIYPLLCKEFMYSVCLVKLQKQILHAESKLLTTGLMLEYKFWSNILIYGHKCGHLKSTPHFPQVTEPSVVSPETHDN